MSIRSIAFSWLIAIGLLGLISVWSNPPVRGNDISKQAIVLPALPSNTDEPQIQRLKAFAWCALESNQIATLSIGDKKVNIRGAMAIDPQWRGETRQITDKLALENCVSKRLEQRRQRQTGGINDQAALAFLFNDL